MRALDLREDVARFDAVSLALWEFSLHFGANVLLDLSLRGAAWGVHVIAARVGWVNWTAVSHVGRAVELVRVEALLCHDALGIFEVTSVAKSKLEVALFLFGKTHIDLGVR